MRRPNQPVQAWERLAAVLAVAFAVVLALRGDWFWAVLIGGLCGGALLIDVILVVGRFRERRAR